ncbi:MAG TPA: hypothetical protein VJR89_32355 [Polyangiales bacterium]|nr:hypothetical protein [Polyangiales bacterium]
MPSFPAARQGDVVTHDLLVPSGVIGPPAVPSINGAVWIEDKLAAFVSCTVPPTCTGALTGAIAHPPLPSFVISGSASVLIHGRAAARWAPSGDSTSCGALLGDPKRAALRTVFIGGVRLGESRSVSGSARLAELTTQLQVLSEAYACRVQSEASVASSLLRRVRGPGDEFLRSMREVRNRLGAAERESLAAQATEARGEHNAAFAMAQASGDPKSPWFGYQMEVGYRAGSGYDQIWVLRDGDRITGVLIVEAKGLNKKTKTAAKLGFAKSKGKQMSKTWVYGTALELASSDEPKDRHVAGEIARAMYAGPLPVVYGVVITGTQRAKSSQTTLPPGVPIDAARSAAIYHAAPS